MTIYAGMGRFRKPDVGLGDWLGSHVLTHDDVMVCTCEWTRVNTTTENPPWVVRIDPDCPMHGGDDASDSD